jgi:hypothetical protein
MSKYRKKSVSTVYEHLSHVYHISYLKARKVQNVIIIIIKCNNFNSHSNDNENGFTNIHSGWKHTNNIFN